MRYAPPWEGERRLEVGTSIASYFWMAVENRWTILAIVVATLAVAGAYLFAVSPTYGSKSVVQVEQRRKSLAGVEDLSAALGESPPAEPEVEIIRSRMLIGAVVDALHLDIEARPRTFPILGRAVARFHRGSAPASPPPFLSGFAWGGERIEVKRLEVPAELVEFPLVLTAGEAGQYEVDAFGAEVLRGTVGQVSIAGAGRVPVEISVSELVARPGTQFSLLRRNREHVIDFLQKELRVQEKGKKSGILVIELEGKNPVMITEIVNSISSAYLRQNVERRSAEAGKTLEFLETQLPKLKSNVDAAETALNAHRVRSGSLDASSGTRGMIDRAAQLQKEIADTEVRRTELSQSFTEHHPNLIAIANKLALLKSEQGSLNERIRSLPQAELSTARLERELKDATDLYVALLNKAQELKVAKSGTIGDVRIIDRAHVSDRPLSPNIGLVLVVALVLGLAGGVTLTVLRRTLIRRAEGPDDVEEATGLPVYVTVPHSAAEAQLARPATKRGGRPRPLLAEAVPADIAIETMRSLRTSLQFALVEAPNNVVVVSGPSPGVGKSFLAANLAHVLASTGMKVLLADCDLRRGHLHRQFGLARGPGVSDVVSGTASLDEAIKATRTGQLYLLPTGKIAPNPAELLSSHRFAALLTEASTRFDLVLIDTPPILVVTDSMLVARFAGVNFLVLRAGMHTAREIALSVKQFALNGIKLNGTVLNDASESFTRYSPGGYKRYEYATDHSD